MIIVTESAAALQGWLAKTSRSALGRRMVLRRVLAFILHRGRMSCSQAAGSVAAESIHRGELTRFPARPRWQKVDFNSPLRAALLQKESRRGKFLFLRDATLVSPSGKKTQNTHRTGHRKRRPAKGRRDHQKKVVFQNCHRFTFGWLMTPSGLRIPDQVPHDSKEYCAERGLVHARRPRRRPT